MFISKRCWCEGHWTKINLYSLHFRSSHSNQQNQVRVQRLNFVSQSLILSFSIIRIKKGKTKPVTCNHYVARIQFWKKWFKMDEWALFWNCQYELDIFDNVLYLEDWFFRSNHVYKCSYKFLSGIWFRDLKLKINHFCICVVFVTWVSIKLLKNNAQAPTLDNLLISYQIRKCHVWGFFRVHSARYNLLRSYSFVVFVLLKCLITTLI